MTASRLAFAGTPEFARVALQAVHAAGHEVVLVLTQPDRPSGRGLKPQASPVKQWAQTQGLPVLQPCSLRLDGKFPDDAAMARDALSAAAPELMVVAAYGLILPPWALALPRRGCLNIHGSLLPRWRGAAPIHRAIEAGDSETGITIMQMDAGLDTGPMLLAQREPIHPEDTTGSLHDRLAALGARLIVQALAQPLQAVAQPADGVTYAHKVEKSEAAVDWRLSASVLEHRLRAFDPAPGCTAVLSGQAVKLWRGRVEPASPGADKVREPGNAWVSANGRLLVACGQGSLELLELQAAGGRRVTAREFLQRFPLPAA
jgi:methionyl-tRNA formyltransferase